MTIYSAVLLGCQRVTDGQTDVKPIAITCFSIADARNKTVEPEVDSKATVKLSLYHFTNHAVTQFSNSNSYARLLSSQTLYYVLFTKLQNTKLYLKIFVVKT